jgi:hypothetical protein
MKKPSQSERAIIPGQVEGFLAGCPFCTARTKRTLDVGVRFRIISGYGAGSSGRIIKEPDTYSSQPHEHLAQMDNDPSHLQMRLDTDICLVQILPAPPAATWALPIDRTAAPDVDAALVEFCRRSCNGGRKWSPDWPTFYELIRVIWMNRLPLEPPELWAILEAHGLPKNWKSRLTKFYMMGRELLVHVGQRRPIKRRRGSTHNDNTSNIAK